MKITLTEQEVCAIIKDYLRVYNEINVSNKGVVFEYIDCDKWSLTFEVEK